MDATPDPVRPDYRAGSLVNLMSSIHGALAGGPRPYAPLAILDAGALSSARNIVLLVIDGMGHRFLQGAGRGSRLLDGLRGSMTSVFPSTTATAITSFLTGVAPQQHALTGWFMYLREFGMVTAILPFRSRAGWLPLAQSGLSVSTILGSAPLFDQLPVESHIVTQGKLLHSEFSRASGGRAHRSGYGSLDEMFKCIRRIVQADAGARKYVYAYWPELDALAHRHGIGSSAVLAHLDEIDNGYAHLLKTLAGSDTALIVTADHGFMDVKPDGYVELDRHPELAECLALPLCGEPRAAYCYLRPGAERRFEDYVRAHLDACCTIHRGAAMIEEGWYGLHPPHPKLRERVGDYVLLMKDGYAIKDSLPGEDVFRPRGVHGGASELEMVVPVIVERV